MGKYIASLLLLGFFFCCFTANAQVKRLALGAKVGYNISQVNLDNINSVNGPAFGITTEYWLNPYSSISLDVIHSAEGYEVPTAVVDYSYLQIPILYNTIFGNRTSVFQPKLNLGLSPGFLLKAEINGVDFKEQNNATVLNLVGGVGSIINISERIGIHVEVRAFVGLTSPELNNSGADPVKNRTLQIAMAGVYGL